MTDIDLKEIEAREEAASKGAWKLSDIHDGESIYDSDGNLVCAIGQSYWGPDRRRSEDNFKFIVHARTDVPRLIAEVRRLRREAASTIIEKFGELWEEYSKMEFQDLVQREVDRSRNIHPPMTSLHEAASIIREEFEEFWEEVRRKCAGSKEYAKARRVNELVQLAAMCQVCYEDLFSNE